MIIRQKYIDQLNSFFDTGFVKVVTGVRRSGKTFILKMYRESLTKRGITNNNILSINFESLKFEEYQTSNKFYDYVASWVGDSKDKKYLFFDEIQKVTDWQKAINSFRVDFNCDIYITGSNASLLSGEISTLIAGRYVEIEVFPLSFKEYLEFKNIDKNKDELFLDYIQEGGFPDIALAPDDIGVKKTIAQGIFDSIVLRDVNLRASIGNELVLNRLVAFMLDNIGNSMSVNNITGTFTSDKIETNNTILTKYINALKNAFIFYKASRYDIRGKSLLKTLGKYYVVDTGLRNLQLERDYNDSIGHQIENIVYIELLRRGNNVAIGKDGTKEIDFVARKGQEIIYYQVAYQLPENDDREVPNLANLKDGYRKKILTFNRMDVGIRDGIEIQYIVDFLLE
ncbi:MAG: ATP-binding protein [Lactobacillales bacterium]|jgi:predicted AAA+ superfamily ATPase|nr:ATP-binding protein [Lactobacillales bacterium]